MFEPIQIDAKITTLADKLGIERSELWAAIVRQARVEAWTDAGLAIFGLLMAVTGAVLIPRVARYGKENASRCFGDWPAIVIIGMIFCCIGLVAGVVLFLINGYNAAQIFPNPVYYAYTRLVY